MKARYITIEREYGSGGTEVARVLSQETGIPCYGSEILQSVSRKLSMSVDEIQNREENMTASLLYILYLMGKVHSGDNDMLTGDGAVFVAEQEAIRQFATSGKGIFVGHSASEALRDYPGVVKVFIRCSDKNLKNSRIIQEYGVAPEKPKRFARDLTASAPITISVPLESTGVTPTCTISFLTAARWALRAAPRF